MLKPLYFYCQSVLLTFFPRLSDCHFFLEMNSFSLVFSEKLEPHKKLIFSIPVTKFPLSLSGRATKNTFFAASLREYRVWEEIIPRI